ncbi:MAG: M56 family metallopeptidase, partial [Turicibacter sp.]|nr:M56 family metallopeptidase [Turicibacter sp.]
MIREALLVSLTMSMVILGFIGLSLVFPNKVSPKIRYRIWTVVMLGLLIPIRPTIGGGIISLDPFLPEEPIGEILPIIPINPSPSPVQTLPGTTPSFSWETALFWVWVLGTAGTLAYHAVQYIRFQRSVKRWSEPEDDLQALEIFNQVKMDLGIKQNIDLVVCSFVSGCMLSGFLRPIILLPEKNFTDEELELIFIHELTHFRRRDLWVKLLSMIAVAIHWFNPLAYVMGGFLQAEGEASCDLEVIERKGPGEKYFYAEVIIGMIGHKTPGLSAMTTHFYGGKRGIKRRLESLMESTPAKS